MSPTYPLLGLLVRGEKHGYELKRIVDDEFAPFWRIDFAQLYRSLARMTRADWVKVRTEKSTDGPDRKMYMLTERGRKEFDTWLAQPARERDEFFVKLHLATDCGASVTHLLEQQRRAFENERAARIETHRAARDAGDVGRFVLADAALRDAEMWLTTFDLAAAIISPERGIAAASSAQKPIVFSGSDDPLVLYLAKLAHGSAHSVGSLGGLLALAQHQADAAGVHLLDTETGEYNVPFVRHLLPEENSVLVNLAVRENGLMLAPGNPKNIRTLRDLTRKGIRFINRQRGAGTRLLLYTKLRAARIDQHSLRDWERAVSTHDAIADAITSGIADVGPGLHAVAHARGLAFIPLGQERYDLVIPRAEFESPRFHEILAALDSPEFRRAAAALRGYDITRAGRVVARVR